MPDAADALLQMEIIKLLLQVAWADFEVHHTEAEQVLQHAQRLGMPPDMLSEIEGCLSGGHPLPAPDMQMLRSRRSQVLGAVNQLLQADGRVTAEERELVTVIEGVLGDDPTLP